jgi:hypothetical protein
MVPSLERLTPASNADKLKERVKSLVDRRQRSRSDYLQNAPSVVERPIASNGAVSPSLKKGICLPMPYECVIVLFADCHITQLYCCAVTSASKPTSQLAKSSSSGLAPQVLTFDEDEIDEQTALPAVSSSSTSNSGWIAASPSPGRKRKDLAATDRVVSPRALNHVSQTTDSSDDDGDNNDIYDASDNDDNSSSSGDDDDNSHSANSDEVVLRLPINDGQFVDVYANVDNLEPMSMQELDLLRTDAASFFETHLAQRADRTPKLDEVPVTLGRLARFPRRVLLRIIGHANARVVLALSRTSRWLYRATHSLSNLPSLLYSLLNIFSPISLL